MLTRRVLMGSAAVLAAACGPFGSSSDLPGQPEVAALTWRTFPFIGLYRRAGYFEEPQEILLKLVTALEEDVGNPNGPARGRYSLSPGFIGQGDYPTPPPRNDDEFAEWIDSIDTDLLSIGPSMAEILGQRGVILPLDRFIAADDDDLTETFYPYLLEQFRGEGGLFALPVDADPLMLHYEPASFRLQGIPPPDETWDWDDVVENALKLTRRDDDGNVTRWGLMPHVNGFWWALWQNDAEVLDPATGRCRLPEPAATEALQFCHDLLHRHRVAPPVTGRELWDLFSQSDARVLAMAFSASTHAPGYNHRLAPLPQGKSRSVPVSADMGLAIHARSGHADVAFTALKGLLQTMQRFAGVPSQKNMVAQLELLRPDIAPVEVMALQRSMEFGRALPWDQPAWQAMQKIVEGLVRADDVASVVNAACSALEE